VNLKMRWTPWQLRFVGLLLLVPAVGGLILALDQFGVTLPWQWLASHLLALLGLLLSGAVVTVGLLAWWASWRLQGPETAGEDLGPASARRTHPRDWAKMTSTITAFTALAALLFTALSLAATREQISLAEQGQLTDRYTKAVDEIGTPGTEHLQVRLGGIFALERLAQDSPRDRMTIIEVLSAYIRSTSPRPSAQTQCTTISEDVQAAFGVLIDLDQSPPEEPGLIVNLSRTCLAGLHVQVDTRLFTRLTLHGLNLSGSDLTGAYLGGSDLKGIVVLSNAKLTNASLVEVHFIGTVFMDHSDLSDADLTQTQGRISLQFTKLRSANLSGADLSGADFTGADLTGVRHEQTIVDGATKSPNTIGAWW
jgi:Pentapeptide repeats (8 copies)